MEVVPCLLLCIPLYCAFRGNRCVRPYTAGTHVRRKKGKFQHIGVFFRLAVWYTRLNKSGLGGVLMKKRTPKRNAFISMGMIAFGSILLLVGAKTSQSYKINYWEILGFIVIVCGIICYLVTVRCPYCGQ